MNKSEKLLAARKKLKEFQMNKGNHNTINNSPNLKHAEDITLQENDSNKNENVDLTQKITEPSLEHNLTQDYFNKPTIQDSNITPEVINTVNRTLEENIQQEMNLLDFPHNLQDTKPMTPEINSNNNNNYELQSTVYNGTTISNELIQSDSLQSSPISRKPSIPSSVTSNNLNNYEYETKTPVNYELENQNKMLSNNLAEEKHLVKQLSIELNQYKEKVFELESCLAMKNVELEAKIAEQVNPLREQIHYLSQTTNILVTEKAELSTSLGETQSNLQKKFSELEESNGKLKTAQNRVEELEKQLYQIKNVADKADKSHQQLINDNESLKCKCAELEKLFEEQKMEIAELRQELNIRSTELINLSRNLEEKTNSLSLAELKIQQLTDAPHETQFIEDPSRSRAALEQQITQLKENIKSVTLEKDELYKHYESYVKQLDVKYENAVKDLNTTNAEIEKYKEREESLIQRLSLMEQQYQREKQKVESLLPLQNHEAQIKHLTDSMDSLVLEQETLQSTLREKDAEIQSLTEELKELRELRDQSVEVSKLVSALESEQLAASRAVSQNEQLKFQLSEMHDAFVTLSNSKLNLTEQLQDERAVGRELNKELNRVELERDQLKEELLKKDEIIQELEKEKLQAAQIADQMHHYQAQSYNTRTLQQELQNALSSIEVLNKENLKLKESMEKFNSTNEKNDDLETKIMKEASTEMDRNGYEEETKEINHNNMKEYLENPVVVTTETRETQIDPDDLMSEPLMKLEKRFKETIERVAELTDEKQRLEHLVLQLQGETETIGEYVTLYQKQRAILQYKAQEREQLFRQLIEQRSVQQTQLHQLKMLVADLLTGRNSQHTAINDKNVDVHVHTNENVAPDPINRESIEDKVGVQNVNEKRETEEKILELLTEIKDCKDTCSLEPNFHPCLWCSGKLITV